ncbi:Calcium/calmodulin-dependent protein kinase kinase 2 [Cyphellophora attinorum]|uniref:Calcium/calmodulin-dependent protein kinase kinase 2 n=1 Tax=Cyphellophora attinorum TaxID=1664694 RepID=A0A0N0NRC9_9EURO|nr:Calcium/calmodulin-dependent protein kinase kinase 2 [Phialophora attinorum]KPI44948.1 Calcium/calmodulin-dependent protein kinase kinase 2 [Phialophora attinorum]
MSSTPPIDENAVRRANLAPSDAVAVDIGHNDEEQWNKPPLLKHVSSPAYDSPLRHHRRVPSAPRHVKESLNARSEYITSQDDGVAEHRINQYLIKQEIGRGSFGAVHLAKDQYGKEYAVKEFSKSRLRKRAQSHILRGPRRGGKQGFNSPLHRGTAGGSLDDVTPNSIDLIKEEIAIMKKLNHPNLVSLIEVLDDPSEDSLYMVMEYCKKGVVMRVNLEQRADPYPEDACRYWFRDLILGIEYLHAQGIVHRDIKPDNCLVTDDDVLKITDFGVSEMFQKESAMVTAKSAGSPAFLPPELCVAKHGDVSGKAADIWSMGVTLYCLKFGRIPFEKSQILDLYESIKIEQPDFPLDENKDFLDLMQKILEKDPPKRIKMAELRAHPWVTKGGLDPLLAQEENTSEILEPPTEAEMNAAITGNMRNVMTVLKAVGRFKALLNKKRPPMMNSILGDQDDPRFSLPPGSIPKDKIAMPGQLHKSHSVTLDDRDNQEGALVAEGVHRDYALAEHKSMPQVMQKFGPMLEIPVRSHHTNSEPPKPTFADLSTDSEDDELDVPTEDHPSPVEIKMLPKFRSVRRAHRNQTADGKKGQARNPLDDQLFLRIGPSTFSGQPTEHDPDSSFAPDDDIYVVSESPGAADVDIYETAYRDEIERILARAKEQEKEPQVYLTRRVDERLLAISGWAGRWMAGAEEAASSIDYYTQFSTRRAKVTEVSRALRSAAKEEYEKRRLERRELLTKAKGERLRHHRERTTPLRTDSPLPGGEVTSPDMVASPATITPPHFRQTSSMLKGKAVDKGRQAQKSFRGLVDHVKARRSRSKDDIP